jgi:uncharacterized protein (DUF952 family)
MTNDQRLTTIFHITSAEEVRQAEASGTYAPEAFDSEGFIHCSYGHQLAAVANRRFAGRSGLVLLEIDRNRLTCAVIDENLEGGTEQFPHVYGRLPMIAVVEIHELLPSAEGRFELWPGRQTG